METIDLINLIYTIVNIALASLFVLCYFYQFIYIFVSFTRKFPEHTKDEVIHDIAVLICARNESQVIGHLIDSLHAQTYPREHLKICVIADNCEDDTADVARAHGATVYERHNDREIGKGYALDALLRHLRRDYGAEAFDAYIVFDADNIADKDFVREVNRTFTDGYDVVTGLRNSKNYGDSRISAANALWFLHESVHLSRARMILHTGTEIKGTGFLFSKKILESQGGTWPYHMLTEDVEFTVTHATEGVKFAYNERAEFFDEQPKTFRASFLQRVRWCRGGMQVYGHKWRELARGLWHKKSRSTCLDLICTITPAAALVGIGCFVNAAGLALNAIFGQDMTFALTVTGIFFAGLYALVFLLGALTLLASRGKVRAPVWKRILYLFYFPVFMFTYLPIAVVSVFRKPKWDPITHSVEEVEEEGEHANH